MERKKFELLNNEKITPYFLSLVKGSKKDETLENITRDDGTEFENPAERKEFIKNSFETLYKKPAEKKSSTRSKRKFVFGPRFQPSGRSRFQT